VTKSTVGLQNADTDEEVTKKMDEEDIDSRVPDEGRRKQIEA
jgi:hypothetical protein